MIDLRNFSEVSNLTENGATNSTKRYKLNITRFIQQKVQFRVTSTYIFLDILKACLLFISVAMRRLMMEKPQRRVSKYDFVLVRRLDALLVHNTS